MSLCNTRMCRPTLSNGLLTLRSFSETCSKFFVSDSRWASVLRSHMDIVFAFDLRVLKRERP